VRTGLIIDVGANIGDGVALIRGAGLNAPVLAIEGAEVWFNLLRSNTCDFFDVALEQVFLGAGGQANQLALHVEDGSSKLVQGDSTIEISSLDTLLLRHREYPVVLLKTDTDGFDAKVIFGARSLLTTQKPVLFVELDEELLRDQGDSTEKLLLYLSECGYSSVGVWDNLGRWLVSRPISEGLSDLILRYPGGVGRPYLDVAVFSNSDYCVLDAICGGVSNGN